MRHYLILEDNEEYFNNTYRTAQTDSEGTDRSFSCVHVTSVDDARIQLAKTRFDGAIIDLHLAGGGTAEGNEIAKQIHRDYLMPIAIVSGFTDEVDSEFDELKRSDAGFFRVFNKNQLIAPVFQFLLEVEESGVSQIVGPGGEMSRMLSDIFWKHLGGVIKQWRGKQMTALDRKRVLRHAVAHMFGALQSNEDGEWDNFLPNEVYIWPPICLKEMPGHIYEEIDGHQALKRYFLLVTPFCDLAKMEQRHFVSIYPFSSFTNKDKMRNMAEKKDYRYHLLPPATFFDGGVVDFATVAMLPAEVDSKRFIHVGSLIEPYWRELVNRLGAWLGRQGTPEFDRDSLLASIQRQWTVGPAIPDPHKTT